MLPKWCYLLIMTNDNIKAIRKIDRINGKKYVPASGVKRVSAGTITVEMLRKKQALLVAIRNGDTSEILKLTS